MEALMSHDKDLADQDVEELAEELWTLAEQGRDQLEDLRGTSQVTCVDAALAQLVRRGLAFTHGARVSLTTAGGELAALLDRVTVVVVPRANPDGAAAFRRDTANGLDVNRDHLLQSTPEGRALGRVFVEYQPTPGSITMALIYPNIVPENNLRLPDALTIKHGPPRLLATFVLEGDKAARQLGIRLRLRNDFSELVYVNKDRTNRGGDGLCLYVR
jgi:hypothetical protein